MLKVGANTRDVLTTTLPRFEEVDPISRQQGLTPELFNLIIVNGCWFDPPDAPEIPATDPRALGHCFTVAWQVYGLGLGHAYIEGLALALPPAWRWVHHGWNLDANGNTRDYTWGRGVAYYGLSVGYRPEDRADFQNIRTPLEAWLRSRSRTAGCPARSSLQLGPAAG